MNLLQRDVEGVYPMGPMLRDVDCLAVLADDQGDWSQMALADLGGRLIDGNGWFESFLWPVLSTSWRAERGKNGGREEARQGGSPLSCGCV